MRYAILSRLLHELLKALTPEVMIRAADALLDVAEQAIEDSETKVDDRVLMPLINMIRIAFNIPDDNEIKKRPA